METIQPMKKVRYRKRPGFDTRTMRWVYRILYPFFHCRVEIPAELQDSQEPVVFIANHYSLFGPASFVLSMPVISKIWINADLVQEDTAAATIQPGIRKTLPFLNSRQTSWISRKLARLASHVLTRFGVIPVDRNRPSLLINTMRQSISELEKGHNLLIFPETGLPEYSLTSVTPFFSGFAMLGMLYYRKTGKSLRFCPCYIDEQQHRIRLGETVVYDPESANSHEETERVSDELNARIRAMAAESRGVKKEKGTPVRQTILFFCNLLRLLLLIPLITMLGLSNRQMILLLYGISEALQILFNALRNTYVSPNRPGFFFSHGVGLLTNISMMVYLSRFEDPLRWVLWALILNTVILLGSNIWSMLRFRRCAGVNYFDSLSSNLLCILCLQQMMNIPLRPLVLNLIVAVILVFLTLSAGWSVAFNARIGREDDPE